MGENDLKYAGAVVYFDGKPVGELHDVKVVIVGKPEPELKERVRILSEGLKIAGIGLVEVSSELEKQLIAATEELRARLAAMAKKVTAQVIDEYGLCGDDGEERPVPPKNHSQHDRAMLKRRQYMNIPRITRKEMMPRRGHK